MLLSFQQCNKSHMLWGQSKLQNVQYSGKLALFIIFRDMISIWFIYVRLSTEYFLLCRNQSNDLSGNQINKGLYDVKYASVSRVYFCVF